ncbi:MAG: hypothetical protein GY757_37710 [bacterium]|nr:hypothetical protein [bacterium]
MKKVSLNKRLTLNKRTIVRLDETSLNNAKGGFISLGGNTCKINCEDWTMTDLELTKIHYTDDCTNLCE